MEALFDEHLRSDLMDRRLRLVQAVTSEPDASDYRVLLSEVDAALARMDGRDLRPVRDLSRPHRGRPALGGPAAAPLHRPSDRR